jgi:hypothetical protein
MAPRILILANESSCVLRRNDLVLRSLNASQPLEAHDQRESQCLAVAKCACIVVVEIVPCALRTVALPAQALQSRSRLSCSCSATAATQSLEHLAAAKFKPLTFCVSGFALSYTADMFVLSAGWKVNLMLVLKCPLLNRE